MITLGQKYDARPEYVNGRRAREAYRFDMSELFVRSTGFTYETLIVVFRFQTVLLAYNLLNWFKRLCAPPHLQRATLQRLRQRLFLVPCQLVRPGGVPTLPLAPSYPYVADFLETL
jgi:hypothetical protein